MYETEAADVRASTLVEIIARGHQMAVQVEQALRALDGVLYGQGPNTANGATFGEAPSQGLMEDARSLVDRLERIRNTVSSIGNSVSSPDRLTDFAAFSKRAQAEQLYAAARSQADVSGIYGKTNAPPTPGYG